MKMSAAQNVALGSIGIGSGGVSKAEKWR